MKSYRTLALKELLSQKVTSILILIAVVLSTMMTTIVAPFNSHYFGQHLARQVLCFPRSLHIRAESFKAGAIFNFRHITSPIYIV